MIDAASTKPFGFMRFEPGPGMGGHCLPIDPFYLAFKARQHGFYTEFVELAGKINQSQPLFCVSKIQAALNDQAKAVRGSRVLILGVSYKAGVADLREAPALKIIRHLRKLGAEVSYHDPLVPSLDELRAGVDGPRRGHPDGRRGRDRHRASRDRLRRAVRPGSPGASTSGASAAAATPPTSSASEPCGCRAGNERAPTA